MTYEWLSWKEASKRCQTYLGNLWSINSHEQWVALMQLANRNEGVSDVFDQLYFLLFNSELVFIGLDNDQVVANTPGVFQALHSVKVKIVKIPALHWGVIIPLNKFQHQKSCFW